MSHKFECLCIHLLSYNCCVHVCGNFCKKYHEVWSRSYILYCFDEMYCKFMLFPFSYLICFSQQLCVVFVHWWEYDIEVSHYQCDLSYNSASFTNLSGCAFGEWIYGKNWNIMLVDFSFDKYILFFPISSEQFSGDINFVVY